MPFATRGLLLREGFGPGPERFGPDTWIQRDICDHAPYPFADDFFDFAFCVQTLEDIRDPLWVCREMSRIARAGYIEVPSLFDELTFQNPEASGGRWLGHRHHRWVCLLEEDELVFVPKWHSLHTERGVRVPRSWADSLAPQERVIAHFWEGRLPARELVAVTIEDYPAERFRQAIEDRFGSTRQAQLVDARDRARSLFARGPAVGRRGLSAARRRLAA